MNRIKGTVLAFAAILIFCTAVLAQEETSEQGQQDRPQITAENYPRVDGSTSTLPLSEAVYRLFTGCSQAEADETVVHTRTTNSYLQLLAGETVSFKTSKGEASGVLAEQEYKGKTYWGFKPDEKTMSGGKGAGPAEK